MTIRDQRQKEFAEMFTDRRTLFGLNTDHGGILYLCPRFGKCRVAIKIFQTAEDPKILITYPDVKIKDAWVEECRLMGYPLDNITFTTHKSLFKHVDQDWDLIVIDEIHLLSEAQIDTLRPAAMRGQVMMGLTGTMTEWTEKTLKRDLGLRVLAVYPMDKAIEEGVVTDYEIRIVTTKLDNTLRKTWKSGKVRTEKAHFDAYSFIINKIQAENQIAKRPKDTKMMKLGRMRIIKDSIAKLKKTKSLLQEFKDERVLVFCGSTATADLIGCPVYHSKKGEKQIFTDFAQGIGNQLAVVKIGNTGVTYKPLNKVIINYFDSNAENLAQKIYRCMAMEYDNPEKKAIIYIITTDEEVEQNWLKKALEFFDEKKIMSYICELN